MPKRGNYHDVPKGTYRAALMDARRACRKGAPSRMIGKNGPVYLCLQVARAIRGLDYERWEMGAWARLKLQTALRVSGIRTCGGGFGIISEDDPHGQQANRRRRKWLTKQLKGL